MPGQQPRLFGSVRPAGATQFGAPETIGGETREVSSQPTALVDPATGYSVALFGDLSASQALVSVRPPPAP